MLIKTILNSIEKFKSFVYQNDFIELISGKESLVVTLMARKNSHGKCSQCEKRCATYDTQPGRYYEYVPLWGIQTYFYYKPRRVSCSVHGIHVEHVPWAEGKEHLTKTYELFLSHWAKRISWKETAEVFKTSWDSVYRAVKSVVEYGLQHRDWKQISSIGVDEIAVFKGQNYLTCVYQLDKGKRRLLWCGMGHTMETMQQFFKEFGTRRSNLLKYVCSDMWAPYLTVIKEKAKNAINILDRFHIMKKFGEAIDQVRQDETKKLKQRGQEAILTHSRYVFLKNPENLTEKQDDKLSELLKMKLTSIRAYLLKENFQKFWKYHMVSWAEKFLNAWTTRAMRSRIEPMKKVAKMLRRHQALILNWFRAKGTLSSGPVEGLNNKAKLAIKKAYGFRTPECLKIALYHQLGNLTEPPATHKFC